MVDQRPERFILVLVPGTKTSQDNDDPSNDLVTQNAVICEKVWCALV